MITKSQTLCSLILTLHSIGYEVSLEIKKMPDDSSLFTMTIFNERWEALTLIAGEGFKYTAEDLSRYCVKIVDGFERGFPDAVAEMEKAS